ncbi:hypothetical protein L1987_74940 [Smallanthus sonchifolius]|uniref:Uncharacterized protein n=1 Tax=Smallanthus sonchifolius TaxID=185202 RepID=A0ACB9A4B7_9ASTR|nr:hypothetical protein L1987_74940 [Smallanthus sonchifolius]
MENFNISHYKEHKPRFTRHQLSRIQLDLCQETKHVRLPPSNSPPQYFFPQLHHFIHNHKSRERDTHSLRVCV